MIVALFVVVSAGWALGAIRRTGVAGGLALAVAFVMCFGGGPPDGADVSSAALVGLLVFVGIRLARS